METSSFSWCAAVISIEENQLQRLIATLRVKLKATLHGRYNSKTNTCKDRQVVALDDDDKKELL